VCVSAESRRNGALSAAVLPAFAPHPRESAEVLGPHAGEAVVLEGVADFVFTEQMGPDIGQQPPKPGGPLERANPEADAHPSATPSGVPSWQASECVVVYQN
jgi:hypothetical protein